MDVKFLESQPNIKNVENWQELGIQLDVPCNLMAYVLQHRDEYQVRHVLNKGHGKKRVVFESKRSLLEIQNKLALTLTGRFEEFVWGEECAAIAYRPGMQPQKEIAKYAGHDWLVSCDLKHYFDYITFDNIKDCLVQMGFEPKAAQLITRYLVVKRNGIETLQQGSPASSVVSNIVGYFLIDLPMKELLGKFGGDVKYLRYCDNLAWFINGDLTEEKRAELKQGVIEILDKSHFYAHDWQFISQNNPKKAQYFIGVILNHEARIMREQVDALRAALFNMVHAGPFKSYEGSKYYESNQCYQRIYAVFQGKVNYVNSVNQKQGLWLRKLLALAKGCYPGFKRLTSNPYVSYTPKPVTHEITDENRKLVCRYKDGSQTLEQYLDMFKIKEKA